MKESIANLQSCSAFPMRFAGAHDALTARLVEHAGFDGVWASGLEISASHGVPDNGLLDRGAFLERVKGMCLAVDIPVWVDVDNCAPSVALVAARVREFELAGTAGLIIEDKVVPKLNSFADGEHVLESPALVGEKLSEAVSARRSGEFQVIARTEALVAGKSVSEALDRCSYYLDCGATGLVVHTKERDPEMMLSVLAQLPEEAHVVAIPTTYFELSASRLAELGVSTVIYANHGIRAQIAGLREAYASILQTGSSTGLEGRIATVEDVFELQEDRPTIEGAAPSNGVS